MPKCRECNGKGNEFGPVGLIDCRFCSGTGKVSIPSNNVDIPKREFMRPITKPLNTPKDKVSLPRKLPNTKSHKIIK